VEVVYNSERHFQDGFETVLAVEPAQKSFWRLETKAFAYLRLQRAPPLVLIERGTPGNGKLIKEPSAIAVFNAIPQVLQDIPTAQLHLASCMSPE
jgi:hypothetical protein